MTSTAEPDLRAREEARDWRMPTAMGAAIFSRVQMAAMAMVPTPMKRMSSEKVVSTTSASAVAPVISPVVKMGSKMK